MKLFHSCLAAVQLSTDDRAISIADEIYCACLSRIAAVVAESASKMLFSKLSSKLRRSIFCRADERDFAIERECLGVKESANVLEDLDTRIKQIRVIASTCGRKLMPWSAKAQELLKNQYAAEGSAARAGLTAAVELLELAAPRFEGSENHTVTELLDRYRVLHQKAVQYVAAYRGYCWPLHAVDDLKLAPFHLLASENKVHIDQDHLWHMKTLARLAEASGSGPSPIVATRHRVIDVTDGQSEAEGIQWWYNLTRDGGEGMVVKPFDFVVRGSRGLRAACREVPGPRIPADHLRA